jgi:MtN3 and saliva related transmembrane protein
MSSMTTTMIGIIAGLLTTTAFIPQVMKTWRTRQADDFSWMWLAMFSAGIAVWLGYGILLSDVAIILANAVTLVLVASIAVIKARGT